MMYLEENKLLFIKPQKVAGTSFEIALSKYASSNDIVTPITPNDERTRQSLGHTGAQNYVKEMSDYSLKDAYRLITFKGRAKKYYNHISAKQIRETLGAKKFDNALKISIVRNPFDRLVSMYHWDKSNREAKQKQEFAEWIRDNSYVLRQNYEHYFIDRQFILDYAIRYENLAEDCLALEKKATNLKGISAAMNQIHAKGGIRPEKIDLRKYYDSADGLRDAVIFFNKELIEMFNFEVP